MKFVLLPPQPAPTLETAHYRPKTLGEHRVAFLNANNPKSWAPDEIYPDIVPATRRKPRLFKTPKQVKRALEKQKQLLDRRAKERWLANFHTVEYPRWVKELRDRENLLHARDRADREWNEMMAKLTPEQFVHLRDEMGIPPRLLASRLRRLSPQEEFDIWKQMSPQDQLRYMQPVPDALMRKHVFGTRSHFSFRDLANDIQDNLANKNEIERLVSPTIPKLSFIEGGIAEVEGYSNQPKSDPHGQTRINSFLESRIAAQALAFSKSSLSTDEYFAQRIKFTYMQGLVK